MYDLDKRKTEDGFYWSLKAQNGEVFLAQGPYNTKEAMMGNIDATAKAMAFTNTRERWIGSEKEPKAEQRWRQKKHHTRIAQVTAVENDRVYFDGDYLINGRAAQPIYRFVEIYEYVS